jgi:hypothetical protein
MEHAHRISGCNPDAESRWQASGLEQEPSLGAHLTTSRRGYSHHGMYVGHGRVVHYSGFSGTWQCGPVEEVSLSRFVKGRPVRTVDHPELRYSPDEIVHRARSRLGENDYRLFTNNCEHFCNWCLSGVSRSPQVERRLWWIRILGAVFHAWRATFVTRSRSRLRSAEAAACPHAVSHVTDAPNSAIDETSVEAMLISLTN